MSLLERKDLKVIGGGTSIVFALAVLVEALSLELSSWFYLMDLVPATLVFVTIIYSLKTQEFLGGEVGRSMSLVAAGLSIYGLTFHLVNLPYQELGNPVIAGLASSFWLTTTHSLQIFGISIAAYGFYSIWRSSR
jgi:hypothetical protein